MRVAAHRWDDIRKELSTPKQIAAADRYVAREILRMDLAAVRKLANKTQVEVARKARMHQGEVSRTERRKDLHVSTIRRYVAALGGRLELVVHLNGRTIRLLGH